MSDAELNDPVGAAPLEPVVETPVEPVDVTPVEAVGATPVEPMAVAPVEPVAEVKSPPLGPGAQLAVHRQERGWTVDQVADQLNLAARQIQALEIDNYAALPGLVIARGFIRAYAKLLKVDPAPLVAMMPGEVIQIESLQLKRALSGNFSESRLPQNGRNGPFSKWLIVATVLVLSVIVLLTAQWIGLLPHLSESMSEKIEKSVTLFTPAPNTTAADGVGPSTPAGNAPLSVNSGSSNDMPLTTTTNVAQAELHPQPTVTQDVVAKTIPESIALQAPPTTVATKVAPTAPVTPAVSAAPVVTVASTAPNKNLMVVKAREDSWVEVKAADNSTLISRLLKAGTTESVTVYQPVTLTVGNASGVDVILRGNTIDLKTAAKNNIVRLNLK